METIKRALEAVQHIYLCEDEGMASGQPTKEDYLEARELVAAALSELEGSKPKDQGAEPVAWMTMDTCPTDRRVLLMHPDVTGEMRCCCWRTGDGFEPEDIGALGWAEFGRTTRTPAAPTSREKAMEEAADALFGQRWCTCIENHQGQCDECGAASAMYVAAKSTK